MRISDGSSDVCSSDLVQHRRELQVLDRDRCLRDWRTRASLVDRHVQSLFFNMAKIAASGRLGQFGAADDAMLVDQVLRVTTAAHGFREPHHRNPLDLAPLLDRGELDPEGAELVDFLLGDLEAVFVEISEPFQLDRKSTRLKSSY